MVSREIEGKPLRMIGTTNDITAMRALSDKLQQSVDLITSLTNEVPGCVYQSQLLPNGEGFFTYVSEGVRDIYELTPEPVVDKTILVTVSIGIAIMAATDASADAPLNRSDLALYRAKKNGRNRIEIAFE